jgi:DNA-binding LacI/PurR family transcriptional regulator
VRSSLNIEDIAATAGVSRTVVSLVINGKADKYHIASETQERVRAVIRQTGYVPDRSVHDIFRKHREVAGAEGAAAPQKVSDVVTPTLSAAGCRVQVAPLARDPAAALSQIKGLLNAGMTVLVPPAPGGAGSPPAPAAPKAPERKPAGKSRPKKT